MKVLLLVMLLLFVVQAFAKIEDNSFLLEEAYNQEWGVYQFIQSYQTTNTKSYDYEFENEIPLTDKVHQLSYAIPVSKAESKNPGIGDVALSYRWQPLNKDGFLLAERFALILPTGNVKKDQGNGVYGFEFKQAATMTVSEKWMNHWNFGFSVLPDAKISGIRQRQTLQTVSAGTSLIYLLSDNFNLMLEGLIESNQEIDDDGRKVDATSLTLNPGFRFAMDYEWKDTQVVPGISFPTTISNGQTVQGVLVYLSIEPTFY